jgi:hypothetical protein
MLTTHVTISKEAFEAIMSAVAAIGGRLKDTPAFLKRG